MLADIVRFILSSFTIGDEITEELHRQTGRVRRTFHALWKKTKKRVGMTRETKRKLKPFPRLMAHRAVPISVPITIGHTLAECSIYKNYRTGLALDILISALVVPRLPFLTPFFK